MEPTKSNQTNQSGSKRPAKPAPPQSLNQALPKKRFGGGSNLTPKGTRHRGGRKPQAPSPNAVPINQTDFGGRAANQPTREDKVKIIPLGGLGEIGKNTMAIEYGNDIIVIDMGFKFPTEEQPGVDYMIAETTYLEKNKHKIRGLVITHAHEDHVGGIPFSWGKLGVPIYGSRFTTSYIEKKLVEYKLPAQPKLITVDPDKHERIQLGAFTVEFIRVTHAIPDPCAILIETPVGRIIHTGDWRIDKTPIDGKLIDLKRFEELGKQGVLLLMSDSTGCVNPDRTPSEQEVEPNILDVINRSPGRVVVSAFASQINRAQSIVNSVEKSGRKLAITGRSILSNMDLAFKLGYVKVPKGLLVRIEETTRMKDDQVVIYCTGSQGEINAILWRMSTGDHPHIKLKPTDSIIFSSSIIPGNERRLVTLFDQLLRQGVHVYHNVTRLIDNHGILHVSGHAYRDELVDMINLTKPKFFVPIHGEFWHMARHAELAVASGIPKEQVVIADNGDVLELSQSALRKNGRVPAAAIMVDAGQVGDVEFNVLRDRLAMSAEGVFMVVATVDRKSGKLVTSPDIISRGFVYMKESQELVNEARMLVRRLFDRRSTREPTDWSKFKLSLRDEIGDFLYHKTKRNPMVIPVINEVDAGKSGGQSQQSVQRVQPVHVQPKPVPNPNQQVKSE